MTNNNEKGDSFTGVFPINLEDSLMLLKKFFNVGTKQVPQ